MSRVIKKFAGATAITLVAGLAFTGATGPATAAAGPCPGMSAPQNDDPANQAPVPADDTATVQAGTSVIVRVLANDSDPDGDPLYVASTSAPKRGTTCVARTGLIRYTPDVGRYDRTDTFTYGVTDGDRYRTATVTVRVDGLEPVKPQLQQRLILKKGTKKVQQRARVAFSNTNSKRVLVLAASAKHETIVVERYLYPGRSFAFSTKERRLLFLTVLAPPTGEFVFINFGRLNTRNGRLFSQYIGESFAFGRSAGMPSTRAPSAEELWAARR